MTNDSFEASSWKSHTFIKGWREIRTSQINVFERTCRHFVCIDIYDSEKSQIRQDTYWQITER